MLSTFYVFLSVRQVWPLVQAAESDPVPVNDLFRLQRCPYSRIQQQKSHHLPRTAHQLAQFPRDLNKQTSDYWFDVPRQSF